MKRSTFLKSAVLAGAGLNAGCGRKRCEPSSPVDAFDFQANTANRLSVAMEKGETSSVILAKQALKRIEALERQGPKLRAVIATNPKALEEAAEAERVLRQGKFPNPIFGLPVLVKDNLDTAGMPTTAGSLALEGSISLRDSFVVGRLKEAGLVLIGKTNLSEWANFRGQRSISGWSGLGGQTLNPHCLDRSPSESSSGSAAAVAAGYVPFAVGTETNGSIVTPASACGIVGIKPTVGVVSRTGIIPISSSQDTAGPMARTVADAAALLAMMMGIDENDPATGRQRGRTDSHRDALLSQKPRLGAKLGIAREFFRMHPLVDPVFEKAIASLREMGAELVDPIALPPTSALSRADSMVMIYEYKAGLNAYFASLGPDARIKSITDLIAFNEREAARELWPFGQERLIEAAGKGPLTDPDYLAAKEQCRVWSEKISAVMDEHQLDAIVAPSNGPSATLDPIYGDRGMGDCSTYAAVAGLPHITVPCGDVFGMPVGLSFFGRAWSEPLLVEIALAFEEKTHALRTPQSLSMVSIPG
ncbi:MAG: amidase [Pedosphaera sp.]|nr:amidase [Pedosphaera sp.]